MLLIIYHVSQTRGSFGAHLGELTGRKISDSAASERRLAMPWEVFAAILESALVPLANPAHQPEAFYAERRLRRPGGAWSEVRLWTRLLDAKAHPALELPGLYVRRWEPELAYHELRVDLRASGDAPLAGHTPDTAAQEIAALLVALAMVARARLQVAQAAGAATLRVSFGRTLAALQPLWMLLSVGGDLLSAKQQRAFVDRVLEQLAGRLLPAKRRQRGCLCAVRQPVKSWPRVHQTQQKKGAYQYELTSSKE